MTEFPYLYGPASAYRQKENHFALAALRVPVDVPALDLGIGGVEPHESVGIGLSYPIAADENPVLPPLETSAHEVAHIDGQGPVLSPGDFPHMFHFGDPIGGF